MRRLSTREFKATFHRITDPEPIEVMSHSRTIGFYFPGDAVPMSRVATEHRMIPGKMPSDHTVIPGEAPRSRTIPGG